MRIGLISDTHGNTAAIDQAVKLAGEIDLWLHAGDMIHDAEYLDMVYDANVVNVAGNCDWGSSSAPEEKVVEAEGHRIFLTHGHIYGVKGSPYGMVQAAADNGADIAVFGHSHVAFRERADGILLINPGSLAYPRDGGGQSFMVLELHEGEEPEVYHYHLEDRTVSRKRGGGRKREKWFGLF